MSNTVKEYDLKSYVIDRITTIEKNISNGLTLTKYLGGFSDVYRDTLRNITSNVYISDEPEYLRSKLIDEARKLELQLADGDLSEYGKGRLSCYYELIGELNQHIETENDKSFTISNFTINKPEEWETDMVKVEIEDYDYDSTKISVSELEGLYNYIGKILNKK